MGYDKGILICGICCLLIYALPIPIASIVIGLENVNDTCQAIDPIGLNLSSWLLGAGIGSLIAMLSIITLLILLIAFGSAVAMILLYCLIILNSLYSIIYTTLGAIILFRTNLDCLKAGTDLAIMSLIVLIFYWVSLFVVCVNSHRVKNTE